jgi:hypothetical protein
MLEIKIQNLPPMPRNASHVPTSRGFLRKTDMARLFEDDLATLIKDLPKLGHNTHGYQVVCYIYTPKEKLRTLKGNISQNSIDFDAHKVFWDTICKQIDIDDSQFVDVRIVKGLSFDEFWNYKVEIKGLTDELLLPGF